MKFFLLVSCILLAACHSRYDPKRHGPYHTEYVFYWPWEP